MFPFEKETDLAGRPQPHLFSPLLAAWITDPALSEECSSHPDCGTKPHPTQSRARHKGGWLPERVVRLGPHPPWTACQGRKTNASLTYPLLASFLLSSAPSSPGRQVEGWMSSMGHNTRPDLGRCALGAGRPPVITASVGPSHPLCLALCSSVPL